MSEDTKKPMIPEWAMIAMALGGGASGVGALGLQGSGEQPVTHAELAEKVDQDDLDKVVAAVNALAEKVTELRIEVKTRRNDP